MLDGNLQNCYSQKNLIKMISRIWHGYTSKHNADTYENLLKEEIFPGIENKKVKGYKGIQILRRELETEVEFTTIMWFENIESVKQFAGEIMKRPMYLQKPVKFCQGFDARSIHCELRHDQQYDF
jgi:hypothetical protein